MKTRQMMMVDSVYLDKPGMYNNGVSWVHLGVIWCSIASYSLWIDDSNVWRSLAL